MIWGTTNSPALAIAVFRIARSRGSTGPIESADHTFCKDTAWEVGSIPEVSIDSMSPKWPNSAFNSPWSYTGLPTVSFPIALSADGLPLAMQLVGPARAEPELFRVAQWSEEVIRRDAGE